MNGPSLGLRLAAKPQQVQALRCAICGSFDHPSQRCTDQPEAESWYIQTTGYGRGKLLGVFHVDPERVHFIRSVPFHLHLSGQVAGPFLSGPGARMGSRTRAGFHRAVRRADLDQVRRLALHADILRAQQREKCPGAVWVWRLALAEFLECHDLDARTVAGYSREHALAEFLECHDLEMEDR